MGTTKVKKPAKQAMIGLCGVSEKLKAALRELARRNNRSLSGEVRAILEAHISAEEAR
jgi:plasmid stability protein